MPTKTSKQIAVLIDELEAKIGKGQVASKYLKDLQHRLNDASGVRSDKKYYQYAFELQALIYEAQDEHEEAMKCVGAAVEQAGSHKGLYSNLLKTYADQELAVPEEEGRTGPGDLKLLSKGEQTFLRGYGLEGTPEVSFLVRAPFALAVMFLLSGGIYGTYWLYKNWQAIRQATERRFSPLWRTLLSIIYLWPLFKIMVVLAKSRGFKAKYPGGLLAAGYIATAFGGSALALVLSTSWELAVVTQVAVSCLYVLFLVTAQQAAAFAVSKQRSKEPRPINNVELIFVLVGMFILAVTYSGYMTTTSKTQPSVWKQLDTRKN